MAKSYQYLSPEWTKEAHRRLKKELTPDKMKYVTSSMVTHYKNCPDGKDRSLYYKFVKGVIDELSLVEGNPPKAEFIISGDYRSLPVSHAPSSGRARR